MKTYILTLLAVLCLCLAPACVSTNNGTSSNITMEGRVYLSFENVWTVTHQAYMIYCDRVALGKIGNGDQADIDKAWNAFRETFKIALKAAQMDKTQFTPDNVRVLSNDVLILIGSL